MISPGPCMIHCGSSVNVGVKVKVGRAFLLAGEWVYVWGKDGGYCCKVAVCEGGVGRRKAGNRSSHVGVIVRILQRVTIFETPIPRNSMRNKANADIPINVFCKCLQRMIQIPENPQTFEREPGAMIWITSVSCAMIAESPPVAITFMSFPSSLRKRSTMPSTMLT